LLKQLIGVIETDFPDLWSKVAVRTHTVGSILWIPRERGMTRLYVELSATAGERVDKAKATPQYVMERAKEAMKPFSLEWKSIGALTTSSFLGCWYRRET
jgi:hypothetical protein